MDAEGKPVAMWKNVEMSEPHRVADHEGLPGFLTRPASESSPDQPNGNVFFFYFTSWKRA
jgi:hypothetical protein